MSLPFKPLPSKTPEQELEDKLQFLRYFSSRAFDLYSDRTTLGERGERGEQELLMSYDVLESLYLSFKEEFRDQFVKLEEKRAQSNLENIYDVRSIYVSVNKPEKLFKIENRRIYPETIPKPYIDVITKTNFVRGFENLIRRIYNETVSDHSDIVVDNFKSWLVSIYRSKRIENAEYLAEELKVTKWKAIQIGLYFAIKDNPSTTLYNKAYRRHLDIDQYQNLVGNLIHRAKIDIPIDLAPEEKRKKIDELNSILIQLLNKVANRIFPKLTLVFKEEYPDGVPITDLYDIFESVLRTTRLNHNDATEIIHNLINRYYDTNSNSIDSIIRRDEEQRGGRRKKTFRKKKSLKKSGKTKRSKKNRKTNKKK
jgi:hypothetical protein